MTALLVSMAFVLIVIVIAALVDSRDNSARKNRKRATELDALVSKIERTAIQYNNIDHACAGAVLAQIDEYRQKEITK